MAKQTTTEHAAPAQANTSTQEGFPVSKIPQADFGFMNGPRALAPQDKQSVNVSITMRRSKTTGEEYPAFMAKFEDSGAVLFTKLDLGIVEDLKKIGIVEEVSGLLYPTGAWFGWDGTTFVV